MVVHAHWQGRCTADDEPWPCSHVRGLWAILADDEPDPDPEDRAA